jgi:serine phosphatase RsbU (regulator of sigma subunit)
LNGVQVSSRLIPAAGAARGGDWCEAFPASPDVIAFSIGVVCGRGVEKYEAMVAMRQAIRDAALRGLDPAQTLIHASHALRSYDPQETASAIYGLLDTRRRSMAFANAGHPPPLMLGPCGTLFLEYSEADLPLGIDPDSVPNVHIVNAPAATLFVFYTDGISESGRDAVQGAIKIRAAATFAYDFAELPTATTIEALMLTESTFDDVAILTARTPLVPMLRRSKVGRIVAPTSARSRWR